MSQIHTYILPANLDLQTAQKQRLPQVLYFNGILLLVVILE
jgi:hypothetical protein